eukprot:TRINITY_DN7285_c0_g1_i1.p1 TRINITY_DN7285_c0_g1~~TRINITY_DN7285_c0_g1_i1.p1  ORF type:complete len:338 (+),score=28.08 TRINITY_DN7285_c0_g1_i1:66-1079(+)
MSHADVKLCTFDSARKRWVWKEEGKYTAAGVGDAKIVCIGDGPYHCLVNGGRFAQLLEGASVKAVHTHGVGHTLSCLKVVELSKNAHTVVLGLGSNDVLEHGCEKVRDGILQICEHLADLNYKMMQKDDDVIPLRIVVLGAPLRRSTPQRNNDDINEALIDFNKTLKDLVSNLDGFPNVQTLKETRLFTCAPDIYKTLLTEQNTVDNDYYAEGSDVRFNYRGQGAIVQGILDNIVPYWPGGNPPQIIFSCAKQVGLREAYPSPVPAPHGEMNKTEKVKEEPKPVVQETPVKASPKSWASVAATRAFQTSSQTKDIYTATTYNFQGIRSTFKPRATAV